MINIDDFNYAWQLEEASKQFEKYVKLFELHQIGLTDDLARNVCPETEKELFDCFEKEVEHKSQQYYEDCLYQIDEIFSDGKQDLTRILGNESYDMIHIIERFIFFYKQIYFRRGFISSICSKTNR